MPFVSRRSHIRRSRYAVVLIRKHSVRILSTHRLRYVADEAAFKEANRGRRYLPDAAVTFVDTRTENPYDLRIIEHPNAPAFQRYTIGMRRRR